MQTKHWGCKEKFTFKEQVLKVLKAILLMLPNVNWWDVMEKASISTKLSNHNS